VSFLTQNTDTWCRDRTQRSKIVGNCPSATTDPISAIGDILANRLAAIIKPKQPLLDWLESQPDWDHDITLEELRADRYALLIPAYSTPKQAMRYVERNHKAIFEMELFGW